MEPEKQYTPTPSPRDASTAPDVSPTLSMPNHTTTTPDGRQRAATGRFEECSHTNPLCVCNTSPGDRADLLREYLTRLREEWPDLRLMPLNPKTKRPAIEGKCRLDSPEAQSMLHTPEEALRALSTGEEVGFALYAGRPEHGTVGLCFVDIDDPDALPPGSFPGTLTVTSGSARGHHLTYRNTGNVANAKATGDLHGAGEVRASNWYVVLPGSVHPSGGVYHVAEHAPIAGLTEGDLPRELLPGSTEASTTRMGEPVAIEDLPPDFEADTVTNGWPAPYTATVGEVRAFSTPVDTLLSGPVRAGYPSGNEADQAANAYLLIYGFEEADVVDIVRACRPRAKMNRRDYVEKTLRKTALTETSPIDPAYGRALIDTATARGPLASVETQHAVKAAMYARWGEATIPELVDSGLIPWGDAKRDSVIQRVWRALTLFEAAGRVERTGEKRGRGGADVWRSTGLQELDLPGKDWL